MSETRRDGYDFSLLSNDDLYLFNEGSHFSLHDHLGSHLVRVGGRTGAYFAVWAPNAEQVHVIGNFNGWDHSSHSLQPKASSGIWEGFIPGVTSGEVYKYYITSREGGYRVEKADPLAAWSETPPRTASVVWDLAYEWADADWLARRQTSSRLDAAISVYEVHLGSWLGRRTDGGFHSYRELAPLLVEYVRRLGFTHIEFLPLMEHPFLGSWGYQTTGYFAPSSRYGTPQDLMFLVDQLHQAGIGVILDWVPSHFPTDQHGPGYFDGTHLYEHSDSRLGFHPDWKSFIFNYGRHEVRSFLISSALSWFDRYHIDGLRVDGVASMLYLDYSRKEGEWIPNIYGGRENLAALDFLRRLNEAVYARYPASQSIAEESTAWPGVSRPTYAGGLGFGLKWDMGWMHDTLEYMSRDPIHRRHHHNEITFRALYAFTENYLLPLSHDEVVHGKGSLLDKMPGDDWQRFANLRLLYGYMFGQPGKKLLFMGGEFGQWGEWQHDSGLDWQLTQYDRHEGIQKLVGDLNRLYRDEPALHELDCDSGGFEWVVGDDDENSVLVFLRRGRLLQDTVLVACNFTPVPRHEYRVGVPLGGPWRELMNSDSLAYGGSDVLNRDEIEAGDPGSHGRPYSLALTLPPLGVVFLKPSETGESRVSDTGVTVGDQAPPVA